MAGKNKKGQWAMKDLIELVKMAFLLTFVLFYAFIGQFMPLIALIYYGCQLADSTVIWYQFLGYILIGLSIPVTIICHFLPFCLFKEEDNIPLPKKTCQ